MNQREDLRLFGQFVSSHAHVFARDATQVLPVGHNYAAEGPVVDEADRILRSRGWHRLWIELLDRPPLIRQPALVSTLEGHVGPVSCVAVSPDGRIAVSGSTDGTMRAWDLSTSQSTGAMPAQHGAEIRDIAIQKSDSGR